MLSKDAGVTWMDAGTKPAVYFDVEFSKDGDIAMATASGTIVRWESSSSTWISLDSTSGLPAFALTGTSRKELSFSSSYNHIVYLSVGTNSGNFYAVYRSRDGGKYWQWVPTPSGNFDPFNWEGWYSQDIMVSPADTNTFYLAGDKFYSWQSLAGWNECVTAVPDPLPGSLHQISDNIHFIAFNSFKVGEMYVGTDRGIYFTTQAASNPIYPDFNPRFRELSNSLLSDVCSTHDGKLFTAGLDFGVALTECSWQSNVNYFDHVAGSGVSESFLLPSVSYYHTYSGRLYKSIDNKASYTCPYDFKADPTGNCEVSRCMGPSGVNSPYNARLFLAETESAFNSSDSVSYTVPYDMYAYDGVMLNSNTQNLPFHHEFSSYTPAGTIIKVPDPIKSRIFIASNCGVWMSPDALKPTHQMKWYKLSALNLSGTASAFDQSPDGDTIYIGMSSGHVYRYVGLNRTAQYNYPPGDTLLPVIDTSNIRGTQIAPRSVSGISVATNQPGVILCSLAGQYSNSSHPSVYKSTNAGLSWSSIQNNLPIVPVNDCLIDANNNNHYLLATAKGFYESFDSGSSWQEANTGFSRTPVTRIRQIREGCDTCYSIYASTFGRGAWKLNNGSQSWCNSFASLDNNVKNPITPLKIFPNPSSGNVTIAIPEYHTPTAISIYDLSGREVLSKVIYKEDEIFLNSGVYFIKTTWPDNSSSSQKIVVVD